MASILWSITHSIHTNFYKPVDCWLSIVNWSIYNIEYSNLQNIELLELYTQKHKNQAKPYELSLYTNYTVYTYITLGFCLIYPFFPEFHSATEKSVVLQTLSAKYNNHCLTCKICFKRNCWPFTKQFILLLVDINDYHKSLHWMLFLHL